MKKKKGQYTYSIQRSIYHEGIKAEHIAFNYFIQTDLFRLDRKLSEKKKQKNRPTYGVTFVAFWELWVAV